jgi:hypothetical protein
MEIDRLRDDDPPLAAADAAPDDLATAGVDEQSAAEPDSRGPGDRAAILAGYRAKAEAAYLDAAREHWETAAKPAFEREWLRYAQTHPADSRSSASIDEAAATSVRRGCADIRETEEKVITPAMLRIEAEDPDRHLIGLEFRRKGEDRIMEKVAAALEEQPSLTPDKALASVKDTIRYTFQYAEEHYTEGVYMDVNRLKAAGFEPFDIRNSWASDEYKGINSRWRVPGSGQLFEVQFHTKISFEAKQLTHPAYERLRDPATSKAEQDELVEFQRRVNAHVPEPRSVRSILDYP